MQMRRQRFSRSLFKANTPVQYSSSRRLAKFIGVSLKTPDDSYDVDFPLTYAGFSETEVSATAR